MDPVIEAEELQYSVEKLQQNSALLTQRFLSSCKESSVLKEKNARMVSELDSVKSQLHNERMSAVQERKEKEMLKEELEAMKKSEMDTNRVIASLQASKDMMVANEKKNSEALRSQIAELQSRDEAKSKDLLSCKEHAEALTQKIEEQKKEAGITDPQNLEEQAISLVGTDIYEKLIKGYTGKQWGRPCTELPAFIIKRLPVRFTYDDNYFNALYQGIPNGGYTAMVEKMLDGTEVQLNVDYLADRENLNALAEKVVYTGPVDAYFGYKLGALQYRSVRFETEVLDTDNYQGNAVVNYTDAETPYTRIIEHKHFEFGTQPKTVISREYSAEWKKGDEPYYPVNDEKNGALYAEYKKLADAEPDVIFGGRLGEYKYYDMDKVIEVALDVAAKELK